MSGGNYTVTAGKLTWTSTTEPANQFVFDDNGYYKYTPPATQTANPPQNALQTATLTSLANATAQGITLQTYNRTANLNGASTAPSFTSGVGVGVTAGEGNNFVDDLETLVINFNRNSGAASSATNHLNGVQNVTINFNAAGNMQASQNVGVYGGVVTSVNISVFDISGNLIGQLSTFNEGNFVIPSTYGNIGRIEIESGSPTQAIVSSISFNHINVNAGATAIGQELIQYTLTDTDGDTSTANLQLGIITNHYAGTAGVNNDTITGSNANDYISGLDGNDTLNGGAGNDVIYGGAGNDTMDGGIDNDRMFGGDGTDIMTGGLGNDVLYGQAGNDTMTGGDGTDTLSGGLGVDIIDGGLAADTIIGGGGSDTLTGGGVGVDVFKWELGDQGIKGLPANDTITDFDAASVALGGDVLDLRDLLTGENSGNLASFLHFEKVGVNTVVHISTSGEYATGFNAIKDVQTITLQNVDLVQSFTNDTDIVADLLAKQKLITD